MDSLAALSAVETKQRIAYATIAGFLFGVNTGNIAGALPYIQEVWQTTTFQNECLVSSTILCAALSALFSPYFTKQLGLRLALLQSSVLFVFGALLAGLSPNFNTLLLARLVLGMGIGISSYVAPLYIAELAPAHSRGFFVLQNGVAITGGEAVAFYMDHLLSQSAQWRVMLVWSALPALLLLSGLWRQSLAISSDALSALGVSNTKLRSWTCYSQYRRLVVIAVALGLFQQGFGINAVMYYGPYIFEQVGLCLKKGAIWATFYMGLLNTMMTIVTALLLDRWGVRRLLLLGSSLATMSLFSISGLFFSGLHFIYSPLILGLMALYIIGYCMSVGSLFWFVIAAIFPSELSASGAGLATAIQWAANFFVSLTFLSMLQHLGAASTFLCYALVCLAGVFFFYRLRAQDFIYTADSKHDDASPIN